jgi:hypothetical protein
MLSVAKSDCPNLKKKKDKFIKMTFEIHKHSHIEHPSVCIGT